MNWHSLVTRVEDQQQLGRVLTVVRDVLAAEVIGAYLFGSAALGGLGPDSDLDALAVSKRRTTRAEKRRLVDRLLAISGRRTSEGQWRRVELTIVVESEMKPWRYPPRVEFLYGDWLRSHYEGGNLEPWQPRANRDLTVLIAMVLLADMPLFGPPPDKVFDPVPHEDVVRASVADVHSLVGDLDSDTRNVILTLARIWSLLATGTIQSKDAAAEWALARLPEEQRPVLARARALYRGEEAEERWEDIEAWIRPFADYAVREIERLAANV